MAFSVRWPCMDLTCPKCQGTMRNYERNGITVDQCTECRGIFLDRGELERLVDAETKFHAAAPSAPATAAAPSYGSPPRRDDDRYRYEKEPERYDKDRYDKDRYDKDRYDKDRYDKDRYDKDRYDKDRYEKDRYYGDSHHKKNKRKSFMEELFD